MIIMGRKFLTNKDKEALQERVQYHLVLGNEVDEGVKDYWSLDLDEWINRRVEYGVFLDTVEEAYCYLVGKIAELSIDVHCGIILPLTMSLKPNDIPKAIISSDLHNNEPPIIDIARIPLNEYLSYKEVKIVHPFHIPLKTYYWENKEVDYYCQENDEVYDTPAYSRFVLLTK